MNAFVLIAIGLAAVAVLLVSSPASGLQNRGPKEIIEPTFGRIFGVLSPRPGLKVSSSYGFPTFEIAFGSKAEMEGAAALKTEFKRELNILFRSYGSVDRPFDAELATFFTYPGHIDEIVATYREKKGPNQPEPTPGSVTRRANERPII